MKPKNQVPDLKNQEAFDIVRFAVEKYKTEKPYIIGITTCLGKEKLNKADKIFASHIEILRKTIYFRFYSLSYPLVFLSVLLFWFLLAKDLVFCLLFFRIVRNKQSCLVVLFLLFVLVLCSILL